MGTPYAGKSRQFNVLRLEVVFWEGRQHQTGAVGRPENDLGLSAETGSDLLEKLTSFLGFCFSPLHVVFLKADEQDRFQNRNLECAGTGGHGNAQPYTRGICSKDDNICVFALRTRKCP